MSCRKQSTAPAQQSNDGFDCGTGDTVIACYYDMKNYLRNPAIGAASQRYHENHATGAANGSNRIQFSGLLVDQYNFQSLDTAGRGDVNSACI